MIVRGPDYEIRPENSNNIYWEQAFYPEWAAISALWGVPGEQQGLARLRVGLVRRLRAPDGARVAMARE